MIGRVLVSGVATGRRRAVEQVVTLAHELGLDPTRVDDLRLAVHECLVNAHEHGHLGDPAEETLVEVVAEHHGAVTVRVQDRARGGGWDPALRARPNARRTRSASHPVRDDLADEADDLADEAADLADEAVVLAERGRGLALVAALTDDCVIRTGSGATTVVFRLGEAGSSGSLDPALMR